MKVSFLELIKMFHFFGCTLIFIFIFPSLFSVVAVVVVTVSLTFEENPPISFQLGSLYSSSSVDANHRSDWSPFWQPQPFFGTLSLTTFKAKELKHFQKRAQTFLGKISILPRQGHTLSTLLTLCIRSLSRTEHTCILFYVIFYHYPYRKPNDRPVYIHCQSPPPPPNIIKNLLLPASISLQLTDISSNEAVFEDAKPMYDNALADSGFGERTEFISDWKGDHEKKKRKNCRRNITWFNPASLQKCRHQHRGWRFRALVNKHFPKGSKLNKIFNRNTLKLMYAEHVGCDLAA